VLEREWLCRSQRRRSRGGLHSMDPGDESSGCVINFVFSHSKFGRTMGD
jgi:hypothetical protein